MRRRILRKDSLQPSVTHPEVGLRAKLQKREGNNDVHVGARDHQGLQHKQHERRHEGVGRLQQVIDAHSEREAAERDRADGLRGRRIQKHGHLLQKGDQRQECQGSLRNAQKVVQRRQK